jgi:shikimate kinase
VVLLARKSGEITTKSGPRGSIRAGGWFIEPNPQSAGVDEPQSAGIGIVTQQATHSLPVVVTPEAAVVAALGQRSIVLIGMMGAGKSSIGRRLAQQLDLPFVDADLEIEKAAGMSIPDIFSSHGEPAFRVGEARVIARLLDGGPQVLATGGGAFMNEDTRRRIVDKGLSVWLKAEFDVLMRRIKRRQDRPLLKTDDPGTTLRELIEARYPIYALADITIQSREVPHDKIVDEIVNALAGHLGIVAADADGTEQGGSLP